MRDTCGNRTRFLLTLVVCSLAIQAPDSLARVEFRLIKLGEERVAFPAEDAARSPRINLAYFDEESRLRWNDTPVYTQATGSCEVQAEPPARLKASYPPRRPRMLNPRVDERLCPGTDARRATEKTLVGMDANGRVAWQRQLVFASGKNLLDLYLIGATPDGLVLSDLEVWSPHSGETLVPAPTRQASPAAPAVPVYGFYYSAIYHPQRREFYVSDADVTLVRRKGGVWRIRPDSQDMALLHPVHTTTILGSYDRVERMALSRDGRYLFLAQDESYRGPTMVSLAVLDLDAGRLMFEERFCKRRQVYCRDPQVVIGAGGHVGFAYNDSARHVLVHYRIAP